MRSKLQFLRIVWTLSVLYLCVVNQVSGGSSETNSHPRTSKYHEPSLLTGKIYAKNSARQNPLFTFTRRANEAGGKLHVVREYFYPDGKVAARERLVYDGDDLLSYDLEELQIGARGRAIIRREQGTSKRRIFFEYSNAASRTKPKTDSESLPKDVLVNDMLAPFLTSHWDALLGGRQIKCRYMVVPRTETVGFTFKKEREAVTGNQAVVIIKMEASSPIIGALVDPVFFYHREKRTASRS